MEDALHEIESMRRFSQLCLSDKLPDETTTLSFRHFLERHRLYKVVFVVVNQHLASQRFVLKKGSIVDATIISAPGSTKNTEGERDSEKYQTKKGNQLHFGMKMHIGVDDALGLIQDIETTSAEVHDVVVADKLLHGRGKTLWGDAGYLGVEKREEHGQRRTSWQIAACRGKRAQLPEANPLAKAERIMAGVRAKVESSFFYIKRVFGYAEVRYRDLAKNTNRLQMLAASTNLLMTRNYLPS